MVEAALNAAAEPLLEWSAHGRLLERMGNRSREAAPQGLYACAGHTPETPRWLALAVADDAQWRALVALLERPAWALDPALAAAEGRRAAHDVVDSHLGAWFAGRERDAAVDALCAAGVPAGVVRDPRLASEHPQMVARGFFEEVDHAVVGRQRLPAVPFRLSGVARWIRRGPPTLGEHSRDVLREWAGLEETELDALEAEGVIGTRPVGA
jgi:crotonobetainyl-CoA:carnitine CoA-transferase CaiB-like acyl-CoA transferase